MTVLRLNGKAVMLQCELLHFVPFDLSNQTVLAKWSFLFGAVMKRIPLTQGQFAKVSDHRYNELSKHKWCAHYREGTKSFYAVRSKRIAGISKTIYMHREITKAPKGMDCDHANHDTLDNQDENLRVVTRSQNNMNVGVFSNNKLGHKGIRRSRSKFRVLVKAYRKIVLSKTYSTLDEAIAARDEAINKHHGDFAITTESRRV